jgi:hypothetical protein
MTLRDLLARQQLKYTSETLSSFRGSDNEFYRNSGKAFACSDLIDLLSDETLNMEVETRAEAFAKSKKKNATCCRCCCQCK